MITLKVTEEMARNIYASASDEMRKILESSCDKKILTGDVMDRVKDYIDACRELGVEPYDEDKLMKLGLTKNDMAYLKLTVVVEALNEGWKPDVYDSDVQRWYPWFKPNGSPSSFAFRVSDYDLELAFAGSGSRLALKSEELANYCGKQFLDLWKEFII